MNLEELKKEYAEQDNRSTAYPIYVTVQELICIGVMADGYNACCPFGDGVTKIKYKHKDYEESFDSKLEIINLLWEDCEDERAEKDNYLMNREWEIEEINVGYIWHPVEFFLTVKGAEEYMKTNAHNYGKLRTYVHYFKRRNFEIRGLLKELGFKIS